MATRKFSKVYMFDIKASNKSEETIDKLVRMFMDILIVTCKGLKISLKIMDRKE